MDNLTVIEQNYGDELTAVRATDGRVYASIRHMCQALGIDDQGQRQRIDRHTVLARGLMVCKLHTIQGERDGYVLRADLVPLWLSGIRTKAVNEDVRPKLERFQEEAAAVLWEAFQDGRLTTDASFDELMGQASADAVDAYRMAAAIMKLARNQVVMEARLANTETAVSTINDRLELLEQRIAPGQPVTEEQASQISQAVKAVALALGKQTGRNEFGACYGELYRKFQITSYKALPADKFDEALAFLTEWHQSLVGDSPF